MFTEKVTLTGHETAGELHDRLMAKGAGLLVKTVKAVESGRYNEHPQHSLIEGNTELKNAPKIFKDDCKIDWNQSAQNIYNFIRGLSPSPAAFTELNGKTLKIYSSALVDTEPGVQPGAFLTDNKTHLKFAAKDGLISLLDVQLEGKKRMEIAEFLRGVNL
ncbi:methionyl-tRNA formyltransferase [Mucilaginibacter antarcticus]|uniref:methionyl-tRNA formyltransferase n=1 Tax=Mucilaginibacter antarcticus TaxID=1855725 RepID=UPI00362FC4A3